jgi:hypothetical protein
LVALDVVEHEVDGILASGRVVFLLEPANPFSDLYSVGLNVWPGEDLVVEVVSPGFDASDLKRGHATPHERLRISRTSGRTIEHTVISAPAYEVSWHERLLKARSLRRRDSSPSSLRRDISREELRHLGGDLLLEAESGYQPIRVDLLQEFVSNAASLGPRLREMDLPSEPYMISMSYVGRDARPVYWDIVWPQLKYEGVRQPE